MIMTIKYLVALVICLSSMETLQACVEQEKLMMRGNKFLLLTKVEEEIRIQSLHVAASMQPLEQCLHKIIGCEVLSLQHQLIFNANRNY
jgi:hypothetical protein